MDTGGLGYDAGFWGDHPGVIARVVAVHRATYRVLNASGERTARTTGVLRESAHDEERPIVGDWVAIRELDAEQAVIDRVLPRRTVLQRRGVGTGTAQLIAANVDAAFIVQSVGRDFSVNRMERSAALIRAGGILPVIVLNKGDLAAPAELDALRSQVRARLDDAELIIASTVAEGGMDRLTQALEPGKTYCFIGSSGVGKSSLINRLLGRDSITTGAVGRKTNRGRHVTTGRQLYVLPGGALVVDNPGTREFGVLHARAGIEEEFDEVAERARGCRFSDCTHANEPGCAVRAAVSAGELDGSRLESYRKLVKEDAFHSMTDVQRRHRDRAFGAHVKKTLQQLRDTEQR